MSGRGGVVLVMETAVGGGVRWCAGCGGGVDVAAWCSDDDE
ncbi:hypothetical protein Tco_0069581, partial [Tanacetum coccineum]